MIEETFDVAIVGGSFAGLAAAMQLARASRRIVVIDAGAPRNRFSPAAHGVPGWDGTPPRTILEAYRADLAVYPTATLRDGRVTGVTGAADSFEIATADGSTIRARRIILAHGVRDILPDVPGLADQWGRTVLHCPYCHGYEVKGRPLAVLATSVAAAHQAHLLRADWSERVTLLTGGLDGFDLPGLGRAGIEVDASSLRSVAAAEDGLALDLSDGGRLEVAALFVGPTTSLAGSPAEAAGCDLADGQTGPFVRVGPMKQTTVPGIFAAGDVASPMPNVNLALADGTLAGVGCHASLVFPGMVEPLARADAA